MAVSRHTSLRSRLALGYAAIALVTALLLGAVLAASLPPFFREMERDYLRNAGDRVATRLQEAGGIGPGNSAAAGAVIRDTAATERVSLKLYDRSRRLLAEAASQDPQAKSPAAYASDITDRSGRIVGRLELSGGPDPGVDLTRTIALAWAVAGGLAVAVGAGLGYLLARRITRRVTELTHASAAMASGDLGVRASVTGDDEVSQLASAFNEMADGVEATLAALKRFVGDAAHEIGTPLTALQADLELARAAPSDPAIPELLERSLGHAGRIGRLSRDLLALSRAESVGAVREPHDVDLAQLVASVVDAAASRAEQAEVELALDPPASELVVSGDPASLQRAAANIIDNALKFTAAGGEVRIELRSDGGHALVRVTDTGCGVPPDDVPHVFERFHRGRNASATPGSGLGLALVKAVAEAHDGSAALESDAQGTVVELRLPLASGAR